MYLYVVCSINVHWSVTVVNNKILLPCIIRLKNHSLRINKLYPVDIQTFEVTNIGIYKKECSEHVVYNGIHEVYAHVRPNKLHKSMA